MRAALLLLVVLRIAMLLLLAVFFLLVEGIVLFLVSLVFLVFTGCVGLLWIRRDSKLLLMRSWTSYRQRRLVRRR